MQDAEIRLPRANRFMVLICHRLDDLLDVSKVVDDPCRQQLAQSDLPEFGMCAGEVELRAGEIECGQVADSGCALKSELVDELLNRLTVEYRLKGEAVEGRQLAVTLLSQNDADARHPVRDVGQYEVCDDIHWTERIAIAPALEPSWRLVA